MTEVQSSDEDDDEGGDTPPDADSEEVFGSPQRVCDHCFYCSILAPLVEWAYDHPIGMPRMVMFGFLSHEAMA